MRTSQKGFTLVELIVVITILAILGTIAFISLQGYSQDARDSKVVSDVTSISREIEARLTQGGNVSVHELRANNDDRSASNGVVLSGSLFGNNFDWDLSDNRRYEVGEIDYVALGLNRAEFLDPNSDPYLIGSMTISNQDESVRFFQVVGQRGGGDTRQAVVRGSYFYASGATVGLVSQTGSSTAPVTNNMALPDGLY